jgi:SHS2 domain-containing protein
VVEWRAVFAQDQARAGAVVKRWEHFEHGADIGVRGFGASEAEAFEQAGLALTAVIADPAAVAPAQTVPIECDAPDRELLFADWLNRIVYEMATRGMLFGEFRVRLDGTHLHGEARGEPIDLARHRPGVEVKGATYTELRVARDDGQWVAQTVVDV